MTVSLIQSAAQFSSVLLRSKTLFRS